MREPTISMFRPDGGKAVERPVQWVEALQNLYDTIGHTNIDMDAIKDNDHDLFDYLITLYQAGRALHGTTKYTMEIVPQDLVIHEEGYFPLAYILRGDAGAIALGRDEYGEWVEQSEWEAKFSGSI